MALTKKQKETNKKLTEQAKKNKPANVKAAAEEAKAKSKKTITLSDSAKTNAVSSGFGGMLGNAVSALKGRKGQGDE